MEEEREDKKQRNTVFREKVKSNKTVERKAGKLRGISDREGKKKQGDDT